MTEIIHTLHKREDFYYWVTIDLELQCIYSNQLHLEETAKMSLTQFFRRENVSKIPLLPMGQLH